MKRFMCVLCALVLLMGALPAKAVRLADDQTILYEGETYRLRKRLTTILILGIDQPRSPAASYREGGQADFQLLLAIDDNRKTVAVLQLDRDTMTEIAVLGVLGHVTGVTNAQLALAHAFGNGRELSCKLAVFAVENLLLGLPVDKYFAMTLDGIAAFNDALGGVEVTLEDDFSAYDPAMIPGVTLRLTGEQAEHYVRGRFDVGDETNASRLKRQRIYMTKAQEMLYARLHKSANFITALLDAVDPYTLTNMSRGFLLNTANKIGQYEILPVDQLAGEHILGQRGFNEFHPDADALVSYVISTFCEPLPY